MLAKMKRNRKQQQRGIKIAVEVENKEREKEKQREWHFTWVKDSKDIYLYFVQESYAQLRRGKGKIKYLEDTWRNNKWLVVIDNKDWPQLNSKYNPCPTACKKWSRFSCHKQTTTTYTYKYYWISLHLM